MSRAGKDPENRGTPQTFTTNELVRALIDVLFSDFVHRTISRPELARRIISPTDPLNAIRPAPGTNIAAEFLGEAVNTMEEEFGMVGRLILERDAALVSSVSSASYRFKQGKLKVTDYSACISEALKALKWRFKIQENIYLAMEALESKGLVEITALELPISWDVQPVYIQKLILFLETFTIAQQCSSLSTTDLTGRFEAPICWLAVLIARSTNDFFPPLHLLQTTGLLGGVDMDHFDSIEVDQPPVKPDFMLAQQKQNHLPQVGFWLPENVEGAASMKSWAYQWHNRYSKVRRVYEKCFGVGSWGESKTIENSIEFWIP